MKKIKGKNTIKSKSKKKKPLLHISTKIKKILKPAKKILKSTKKPKVKIAAKKPMISIKKIKKLATVRSTKPAKKSKPSDKTKSPAIKKASIAKPIKKNTPNNPVKSTKKLKATVVVKAISTNPAQIKRAIAITPAKKIAPKTVSTSNPLEVKSYTPTKNEMYMSPKQIEHFKIILNIWKEQLMDEMNRTVQHMKTYAANFPDPVDRASQEEDFNLELKTRERERKLIKKIDEALEKIQGGDYGFCVECGAEIGIKRLEARPTAFQCIECKTIAEIREKQTGG